jgi:hypothetical protein
MATSFTSTANDFESFKKRSHQSAIKSLTKLFHHLMSNKSKRSHGRPHAFVPKKAGRTKDRIERTAHGANSRNGAVHVDAAATAPQRFVIRLARWWSVHLERHL